jgi:phosphopantetheinyl transferase
VDVEPLATARSLSAELFEYALTPGERQHLEEVPPSDRTPLFLSYWTGKEAVLKAIGTGLQVAPHVVGLPAPAAWRTNAVTVPRSPQLRLWIQRLDVDAASVCTLATDGQTRSTTLRALSPTAVEDLFHAAGHAGRR